MILSCVIVNMTRRCAANVYDDMTDVKKEWMVQRYRVNECDRIQASHRVESSRYGRVFAQVWT